MNRNIKTSFRQLKADKTNTVISVTGLIFGLGIVAAVLVFVLNEINYNNSFANKNRIYRVLNFSKNDNNLWASTPFVVGESAKNEFAEVESIVHQYNIAEIEVKKNNDFISEQDVLSSESSIFNVFGIKVLQGSLANFDETAGSVALSKQLANKYFGTQNPVGQTLTVRFKGKEFPLEVAAIYADIPRNSTVKPNLITNINLGIKHLALNMISNADIPSEAQIKGSWNMSLFTNYILLKKGVDKSAFEAKLKQMGAENSDENMSLDLSVQPFSDIYFGSNNIINNNAEKGNKSMLVLMSIIGLMILLVATINYLNLASAKTMAQVKNFAVRKVCGAGKRSIVGQIISQSTLVTLIALPFAVLVAWLSMPLISRMLDKSYTIEMTGQITVSLLLLIAITLATGIIAGLVVSVRASNFSLVSILKGNKRDSGNKNYARKAMVVFQLAVFIVLIAVTFLVQKQVRYTFNKDLGFAKEGLISVPLGDHNLDLFKLEIEKSPNVLSAAGTLWMPPSNNNIFLTLPKVSNPDETAKINALFVDYNFVKTMGLTLKMGADFDNEKVTSGVIVNELAVKALGLTDVLGEQTAWGKVVGVVEDFNMSSLHQEISPMLITLNRGMCKNIAIRLRTENLPETIDFLKKTWQQTGGTSAFSYQFTNDTIKEMYQSDIRFSKTIGLLTIIAIVIASLGLFGLSLLMGKQRTKEIGIRKVNGAKISEVLTMLNKDFVKWVAIAFVIACPVAYYAMNKWLENFAYKTNLSWWIFALAGVLALGIALLTVSWQSWKAATRNPVEALRYE